MLIAAFIVVLSLAAILQFAALSWRAGLLRLAAEPFPKEADFTGAPAHNLLQSNDFRRIHAYQELCPDLGGNGSSSLRSVYVYYRFLQSLDALAEAIFPKGLATAWAQGEMELCGRYAGVVLCQRLARNRALLAEFRA